MTEAGFTIRCNGNETVLSFDDGRDLLLDYTSAQQVREAVVNASGATAVFSASTRASFAEARHAEPRPMYHGRLVDMARSSRSPTRRDVIPLGGMVSSHSAPFAEVLERRQSGHTFAKFALPALATVLVRSARVRSWTYDERGIELTTRPHPSAGALHPLTIEVLVFESDELAMGTWEFDPFSCELVLLDRSVEETQRAVAAVAEAAHTSSVGVALLIVADPALTLSRYPNGTAHVWRDGGCLLATLHLVATDVGLSSRIVGTSGVVYSLDKQSDGRVDVGALVIGSSAP